MSCLVIVIVTIAIAFIFGLHLDQKKQQLFLAKKIFSNTLATYPMFFFGFIKLKYDDYFVTNRDFFLVRSCQVMKISEEL